MSSINRYLAPTPEEVSRIRDDVLRLRTCGLTGHSALFHGHAESLMMLVDLYQEALAYLGAETAEACPGCDVGRGDAHGADCWVSGLVDEAQRWRRAARP